MKKLFEENWSCLQCGQCKYFKVNADMDGIDSSCKRLDHKRIKFAVPWFKSYDCGQTFGTVCRDFEPANYCKWLKEHWVSYDDYYGGDIQSRYVHFCLDNNRDIRYAVKASDFINGTFINSDGSLKWVKRQYYKKSHHTPTGYMLITENNYIESIGDKTWWI